MKLKPAPAQAIPQPSPNGKVDVVKKLKQQAEENEVAGRHKNDGRNDHAGHKVER